MLNLFINCDELDRAIRNGDAAKPTRLANVGLEHDHMIFLQKVTAGSDPNQMFHPKNGAEYFKIRPNAFHDSQHDDRQPSNENGKLWDWYLLSCPHGPPCPFMQE